MKKPSRVQKFPIAKQRRLDRLSDKNSEGTITDSERLALTNLVAEAEQLMVDNARELLMNSKSIPSMYRHEL